MRAQLSTPTPLPPPPAQMSFSTGKVACRGRGMNAKEGGGGLAAPSLLENLLPPLRPSFPSGEIECTGGEGGEGGEVGFAGAGGQSIQGAGVDGTAKTGSSTLIIGLGNLLRGDDGLGPAVVDALRRGAPRGLTLIESSGHDLAQWLTSDAFDRIVVVDAADLGQAPGSWLHLTPERLAEASGTRLTHGMGLAETLELLAALGVPSAPISIYAVQPAVVGWGPGLSREVLGALAAVATAIRQELCLPNPRRARTVLRTDEDVRCLPCSGQAA